MERHVGRGDEHSYKERADLPQTAFSNFLFGIYSKNAWLMAQGISPSFLETWSRTWFALNDKIAPICFPIARLNKLGSSSWFIIVIHQSSQCDAYLRGMVCSDCNWRLRCTDSCHDNLLHVRPAWIWSIRGSSDLMHAADQAKTLCWIRATFGMSCFFACSCGCQEFASLKFVWKILSFVWDGLLFHPHLQFGISSVAKLHDPTLTHLFSFD